MYASDDIIAEQLYSELASIFKQGPKHHVTIVAGDTNAQIGKIDCKGTHFHERTNRNGQLLLDTINKWTWLISTKYTKRIGKIWTFTYPNGEKAQLDHCNFIHKNWTFSFKISVCLLFLGSLGFFSFISLWSVFYSFCSHLFCPLWLSAFN